MSYVLIDKKTYKPLVRTPEMLACEYFRDILIPVNEYAVLLVDKKSFSTFEGSELFAMFKKCYPVGRKVPASYAEAVQAAFDYCSNMEEDTTSVADLLVRCGGRPQEKPTYVPPLPFEKRENVKKAYVAKVGRPKEGSTTGKVWDIADELFTEGSVISKAFRTSVIEGCIEAGLNASTAATQYAKWKKYITTTS